MLLSALGRGDPADVPETSAEVREGGHTAPAAGTAMLRATEAAVPFPGGERASEVRSASTPLPPHSMPSAHADVSTWPGEEDAAHGGSSVDAEWQEELDALQRLRAESADACSLCGGPKEEASSGGGRASCLYCERLGG